MRVELRLRKSIIGAARKEPMQMLGWYVLEGRRGLPVAIIHIRKLKTILLGLLEISI